MWTGEDRCGLTGCGCSVMQQLKHNSASPIISTSASGSLRLCSSSPHKSRRSISALSSQISQVCFSSLLANLTGLFQLTLLPSDLNFSSLLTNLTGLFPLTLLLTNLTGLFQLTEQFFSTQISATDLSESLVLQVQISIQFQ